MQDDKFAELFKRIGASSIMVLATADRTHVSARAVSVVVLKEKFYFQTDKTSLKASQLIRNPHAALSFSNINIEGKCKNLGRPLSSQNNIVYSLYKKCFAKSFKNYGHMENEILIEFTPTKISSWDYEGEKPYEEFYNFKTRDYKKQYYDNSK